MRLLIFFLAALIGVISSQSYHPCTVPSPGRCENNPFSLPCGDGTTCQCTSLVWNHCPRIPDHTNNWRPGMHVLSNCAYLSGRRVAIASFSGGVYDWRNNRGHAGIFMGCSGDGFNLMDQWCGVSIANRFYPRNGWDGDADFRFRTAANNYYTIV